MSIGQAVNIFIEKYNITKYKVAKEGGISQTALGEIVSGKNNNPTIETISKIAIGLGISAAELVRKAEEIGG